MEKFIGTLYHDSHQPEKVLKEGLDINASQANGSFFFTDQPQPNSNILVEILEPLNLYEGNEYGYNDPNIEELSKLGYDGSRHKVQEGDVYVSIGNTEIMVFPNSLNRLGNIYSYYYAEEEL